MPHKDNAPQVEIEPVRPEDTDAALRLYARCFHGREPLMRHMGFSEERMVYLARLMHLNQRNDSLQKGLWWLARDVAAEGAPIGLVLCGDILDEMPDEPPKELTPEEMAKVPALMALLEDVRGPLSQKAPIEPGECLHVAALGVLEGYGGMGVATALLRAAVAQGAEVGFRVAASVCTVAASRRCHEKCGFVCLRSVQYNRFESQGARPFEGMEGSCHLMRKVLRSGG